MEQYKTLSHHWAAKFVINYGKKRYWRYAWCFNVATGIIFAALYLNSKPPEAFWLVFSVLAFGQLVNDFERSGFLHLLAAKDAEIAELRNQPPPKP